jgi:hypothetical protein
MRHRRVGLLDTDVNDRLAAIAADEMEMRRPAPASVDRRRSDSVTNAGRAPSAIAMVSPSLTVSAARA